MTPAQALAELKAGNQRFINSRMVHPRMDLERVKTTFAAGSQPFAVVLACSDSRVPPEIVFDQGIGDLFVVRVGGNVANGDEMASVEFAVEYLNTPLCVVMGHTDCNAVKSVVERRDLALDLDQLFWQMRRTLRTIRIERPDLAGKQLEQAAVRANIRESIERIAERAARERVQQNKLLIIGAEYQTNCGEVVWIEPTEYPQVP